MRTIIAQEPNKRIVDIFQSNSNITFTFLPVFRYQELSIQTKWLNNVKNGYFNWSEKNGYQHRYSACWEKPCSNSNNHKIVIIDVTK